MITNNCTAHIHTHTHVILFVIVHDKICQSSYCKAKRIRVYHHIYALRWCRERTGKWIIQSIEKVDSLQQGETIVRQSKMYWIRQHSFFFYYCVCVYIIEKEKRRKKIVENRFLSLSHLYLYIDKYLSLTLLDFVLVQE